MAVTFTIQIDEQGRIGINGPLHDKILCWGMLEAAKQAVADYKPAAQPLVQGVAAIPNLHPLNGKKVG